MPERTVGYVLKGYPRRSELFIASEIWRLEQLRVPVRLFVIKGPRGDRAPRRRRPHPRRAAIPARHDLAVRAAPWPLVAARTSAPFRPALFDAARRHPVGLGRAAAAAVAQSWRARHGWRPRSLYAKELLQAVALAAEVDRAGDVERLHAHFAHGTTTVTWLAAMICGLPFSFTGHAKDIYRESLNPAGLLARKLRAATFVATCTRANLEHLRRLAPQAEVHLVYHGLNPDFARLLESAGNGTTPPVPGRQQLLRVVSVGRQVPKKGFDVLLRAIALLRDRGVDLELVLVGETGDATPTIRGLVDELGLARRRRRTRAVRSTRAPAAVPARPRSSPWPAGSPTTVTATGSPTCWSRRWRQGCPVVTTAVSGIPELVRDGENGLLVPPSDPAALADALARVAHDPALREHLAGQGPVTVSRDFDALTNARRMASLLEGAAR